MVRNDHVCNLLSPRISRIFTDWGGEDGFSRVDREILINSDERQRATLTLRLMASHYLLPNPSPEGAIKKDHFVV